MNTRKPFFGARRALRARTFAALLLAAGVLAGCARRYDMILTNGQKLTNIRKPTRNQQGGYYSFIDARGHTNFISVARVTLVEPHRKETFTSPQ